ncbi:MAG: hypothetical protein PWP24_1341 [Clostridiales bacterium]|nr:hypothetical protein [Clostridiales bacterium]
MKRKRKIGRDVFVQHHKEINAINQETFQVIAFAGGNMTGLLFALSFFIPMLTELRLFYFCNTILLLAALLINHYYIIPEKKTILPLLYISIIEVYLFGIIIGTVHMEDQLAIAICVFFTVLPMFIIDWPIRICMISTVMYLVFVSFAFQFKPADVAKQDAINSMIYLLIGYYVCFYSTRNKLDTLLSKKMLKEQRDLDALTKLYNRGAAQIKIEKALLKKEPSVLILLDIDNFKLVNDTYGHGKGDEILIDTANLLREVFGKDAIASRIGGDEFIIFLPNCNDHEKLLWGVNSILVRMREEIGGKTPKCNISASLGIVYKGNEETTFDRLYKNADLAMYNAKKIGKGTFVVYEE